MTTPPPRRGTCPAAERLRVVQTTGIVSEALQFRADAPGSGGEEG